MAPTVTSGCAERIVLEVDILPGLTAGQVSNPVRGVERLHRSACSPYLAKNSEPAQWLYVGGTPAITASGSDLPGQAVSVPFDHIAHGKCQILGQGFLKGQQFRPVAFRDYGYIFGLDLRVEDNQEAMPLVRI